MTHVLHAFDFVQHCWAFRFRFRCECFVVVVVVYLIGHLFHLFICAWNKIWCSSALYFQFYFYLHSYNIISFSPRINTDVAQYCWLEFFFSLGHLCSSRFPIWFISYCLQPYYVCLVYFYLFHLRFLRLLCSAMRFL